MTLPEVRTEHAPEPWRYDPRTGDVYDASGAVIAMLVVVPNRYRPGRGTVGEGLPELDATGRLMARAPRLLFACRAALLAITTGSLRVDRMNRRVCALLEDAIRGGEGGAG